MSRNPKKLMKKLILTKCLMRILKATKRQGFIPSQENSVFGKKTQPCKG